jgi:hypothetical protein
MSKASEEKQELLINELKAIKDVQKRIDSVARDLESKKFKYSVIDSWDLGELLGLDFSDTAEYEASSTSWYEGMRYSNGWTFADAKVNIDGEDGMQCVVDLPVEELYVNTSINGEYQN